MKTGREPGALWWRTPDGRRRELVTPEGVPLVFTVSPAGDRIVAFFIDASIISSLVLLLSLASFAYLTESTAAVSILLSFFISNFYFIWFEHRWHGRTPGKRVRKLQVVDADGGQLGVEAVIVRNLTRHLEIVVPLIVLLAPGAVWPGAPPWSGPLAGAWILCFAFMPLFNHDRRRLGDLAAGTLVIRAPQAKLLSDLADRPLRDAAPDGEPEWTFTQDQLSRYGVYELQVLEEVLRSPQAYVTAGAVRQIREKIQAKIGYEAPVADDIEFLRAFYAAQRAYLERRMLLGKRRRDKHDTSS